MLRHQPFYSKLERVPTYRDALPVLAAEIDRARRYERPLSLAVIGFEGVGRLRDGIRLEGSNGNGNGNTAHPPETAIYPEPVVTMLLGAILRDALRETDRVSYDAVAGRYVIVMPELNRTKASQAVQRLHELVLTRIFTAVSLGVAEFPHDGLTLEELVTAARQQRELSPLQEVPAEVSGGRS